MRPLGRSTWLVREERSGEEFVLRVCARGGAGPGLAPAVARAAAGDLAGRQTPHLVAVRALLGPAATPVGLVEDRLAAGSLAERLARRGPLRADEAAEVLRGAAAGLAALHALGAGATGASPRGRSCSGVRGRTASPWRGPRCRPAGAAAARRTTSAP
ncbi:hypothetical protein [Kocuria rosea]|uniref:hypothetical protein n=1 Tax=Kocuria rosea TaxID=1275 RepID=UPI00203EE6CE|nr:hypothetical protein [Kocuria rosea]MCM3688341.1 hypothetical protein [Kocuria rosea]